MEWQGPTASTPPAGKFSLNQPIARQAAANKPDLCWDYDNPMAQKAL